MCSQAIADLEKEEEQRKEEKKAISTEEHREIEAKLSLLEGISRRPTHGAAGHDPQQKHNGLKEAALAKAVMVIS